MISGFKIYYVFVNKGKDRFKSSPLKIKDFLANSRSSSLNKTKTNINNSAIKYLE